MRRSQQAASGGLSTRCRARQACGRPEPATRRRVLKLPAQGRAALTRDTTLQGSVPAPTYRRVCGGRTGHVEAVRCSYDPDIVQYAALLDVWWSAVDDPTDGYGQGADRGPQYRLGVYWHDEAQRVAAQAFLDAQAAALRRPLAVELRPAAPFHEAEECHQAYFAKGARHDASVAHEFHP